MDEPGYWVILLTENTPENREQVFLLNPTLTESNATFKEAAYSYKYLTDLMESLSRAELPLVTSIGFREERNRIQVFMAADDADAVAKVLAFDAIGSAIEITFISEIDIQADERIVKRMEK